MFRSKVIAVSLSIISFSCVTDAFSISNDRSTLRPICTVTGTSLRMSDIAATPGSDIVMINDKNMDALLKDGDKPVLIDAMALWCGPCKVIEPVIKRLAQKWDGVVAKYFVDDVDETEKLREELKKNNVLPKSLPSLILYQGGTAVALRSGILNDAELDEFITLCSDDELDSIDFDMPANVENLVNAS